MCIHKDIYSIYNFYMFIQDILPQICYTIIEAILMEYDYENP